MSINGAIIFDTVEDAFVAIFGPLQHDAHVVARRHWKWLDDRKMTPEKQAALDAAMRDFMARRAEAERAP